MRCLTQESGQRETIHEVQDDRKREEGGETRNSKPQTQNSIQELKKGRCSAGERRNRLFEFFKEVHIDVVNFLWRY